AARRVPHEVAEAPPRDGADAELADREAEPVAAVAGRPQRGVRAAGEHQADEAHAARCAEPQRLRPAAAREARAGEVAPLPGRVAGEQDGAGAVPPLHLDV